MRITTSELRIQAEIINNARESLLGAGNTMISAINVMDSGLDQSLEYNLCGKVNSICKKLRTLLNTINAARDTANTVADAFEGADAELKKQVENMNTYLINNYPEMFSEDAKSSHSEQGVWCVSEVETPLYGQEQWYTCGAASGRMVLGSLGINVSENEFAIRAGTYDDGSTVVYKLRNALNYYIGSDVYHYQYTANIGSTDYMNMLRSSISNGHPVVVNVGIPASNKGAFNYAAGGHYVVVTGVSEAPDGSVSVQINDPFSSSGENHPQKIEMSLEDFKYYNSLGNGYSIFG